MITQFPRAALAVLHDDGEYPHLVSMHQMCWTLRSKSLLVVGNDGHKIEGKFTKKIRCREDIEGIYVA
jgi:hypothetical protein